MGISVLIVDDSLAICQVLAAMLKEYRVDVADYCLSAEEALSRLTAEPTRYDAIFVDLHLQGMDGLELMHQLSELQYAGGIIVMSGLEKRIIDFTLEVISNYALRVLGSIEKPLDKALVGFMVKRISNYYPVLRRNEKQLSPREIMAAIEDKRVRVYFQPKISSIDNSLVGLEALVRLQIKHSIISPVSFINVAERFRLIDPLTGAILDAALPVFRNFRCQTGATCSLAINISPLQLYNNDLPATLQAYLRKHDVNISQVVLEITENHAIRDERQLKNLNRLRIHGYRLSLDDYGAGFTNLRQLQKLPFNEIKLDGQLVQGIHSDKLLQVIVRSIRTLTKEMGLKLIAEGVADARDLVEMNDIGVDAYQGYLFCRPKPMDELIRWHAAWQKSVCTKSNNLSAS